MKTELEIIKGARELLSDPERWGQRFYASLNGFDIDPLDPRAKKFCAIGAMWRVAGDGQRAFQIGRDIGMNVSDDLVKINDGTDGYQRVLCLFDNEIAKREEMKKSTPPSGLPAAPMETPEPVLA